MIESIMFFGLGFLAASLMALVILPLVHARAVRLTTRRVEASTPLSIAEIQADKDQLRAEFALSTRKLEQSVEQLKAKTASQLTELGRKSAAISDLKTDVAQKATAIAALEARVKTLAEQLQTSEQTLAAKTAALAEAERKVLERDAELAKLGVDISERSATNDGHRIEIVALNTQLAALKGQLGEAQSQAAGSALRLTQEQATLQTVTRERDEARATVAETVRERDQLRNELAALRRIEADLRQELERTREERATMQRDLAVLHRDTEPSWGSEREENAVLRDRINQVAAEVARLTAALEGPESPINAILAAAGTPPAGPAPAPNGAEPIPFPRGGNLADRIRALQARAGRASSAG